MFIFSVQNHRTMESSGVEKICGDVLTGELDIYNGLTVLPQNYAHIKQEDAKDVLKKSIKSWVEKGHNGIWFRVDIQVIYCTVFLFNFFEVI